MNKKVIIISVLGLIGVGVGAYFFLRKKPKAKKASETNNTDLSTSTTTNGLPTNSVQFNTQIPVVNNSTIREVSPASLSDLQAVVYLVKYADLNEAFNGNLQMAKEHWINLGKSEKRTITLIKNNISSPTQLSDEQAIIYLSKYPD
jgi:hypothetical protein